MCKICHSHPCDTSCSNAGEPKAIYKCGICGEGITGGEEFAVDVNGRKCHVECLFGKTNKEILSLLGTPIFIAEE